MMRLHQISKDRQCVTYDTEGPRAGADGRGWNCQKSRVWLSKAVEPCGKLLRRD